VGDGWRFRVRLIEGCRRVLRLLVCVVRSGLCDWRIRLDSMRSGVWLLLEALVLAGRFVSAHRFWGFVGWSACDSVSAMSSRLIPLRVGDVDLLVESMAVAGSQPTSGLDRVGERVVGAFERAQAAIVEVASSVAGTVQELEARSRRPDRVEVEFGVKFTASGDVVVASASGEASLRVLVSYDVARDPA
jgi:hypothetical protein